MKKLLLVLITFLFSEYAFAGPWPCDYSGADTMNCYAHKEATSPKEFLAAVALDLGATVSTKFTLDLNGNITKLNNVTTTFPASQGAANSALANDGSGGLTWSTAFLINPMTTTGDIIYSSNNSGSPARLGIGGANTVVHGGATPSYSAVVDGDFSGQLSTAKGGTGQNSSATFPTSGVVLTDTNSVTVSNKTLNDTNSLTIDNDNFTIHASGVPGKQAVFSANGISAATTRTFTFPDANTTLVGTGVTQTLTNKTLSGNTAVSLINGTGTFNFNSTGTLTAPNATDTLVGKATTDTLTNKSIAASEINSGQLATANGGTGQNSTATFPTSGVVVTEAASETLTNKILTIDGGSRDSFESATGTHRAIKMDVSGATDNTATFFSASQTADRTLVLPNANTNLVGHNTTDTLTNKSIAASEINSGTLAVAQGGTNLASGTSGGVLGYTASGTLASSAALTANGVVLGGGAGATPTSTAAGTTSQVLIGGTPPTFGNVPAAALPTITQTTAGVDTNAAQRLGTNTNDLPTAGNIGEVMNTTVTNNQNTTSATFFDAASLALTAGDWLLYGQLVLDKNAATVTAQEIQTGFSTTTGNSSAGLTLGDNMIDQQLGLTTASRIAVSVSAYHVRLSGTTTYYLKGYPGSFTGGPITFNCRFTAVRIR